MTERNENGMERKDVVSKEEPERKAEESQISGILDEMDEDSNRSAKVVAVIVGAAAVMIAIIIALLVSLGKKNQEETTSVSSVEQQETTTKETETKKEVEEVVVVTPEPTAEPTPEPTPEPIVYEGIDMESTLPGKEWMATFEGIIEEPKFVVFNDETNKKVIVEDGQEVKFESGDTFAMYAPTGTLVTDYSGIRLIESVSYNNYYNEFVFNMEYFKSKKTFTVEVDVDGKIVSISCRVEPVS